MAIYDLDYVNVVTNLLPVLKRKPIFIAWLTALLSPLQWLHDNFFNEYANGSNASLWFSFVTYQPGDRVVDDLNNAVYECYQVNCINVQPSTNTDPAIWQLVSINWRGVRERLKYNSQKITLEYALNKYFRTTWVQPDSVTNPQGVRPDIYIDNANPGNLAFVSYVDDANSSDSFFYDSYQQNFIVDTYSFANAYWFTIYVPAAFFASLGSQAELIIRSFADKYVLAGVTYGVTTY